MSVPYDDSGLAPSGYAAVCAMPNYPVYDVQASFGAKGDGKTDDTMAIRNAIAAASANGSGIIYFAPGTYAVCCQPGDKSPNGDPAWQNIFFLGGKNNIVFLGSAPVNGKNTATISGYMPGLQDPKTIWVNLNEYAKIARFEMFGLWEGVDPVTKAPIPTTNIQFRSLNLVGNAGYTGNFTVGGIQSSGDGWDITHKAIMMNGPGLVDNILIFNCNISQWRGEEVYAGGTTVNNVYFLNGSAGNTNASCVSCSANFFMVNALVGGSAGPVYNGVENYAVASPQQTTISKCTISCPPNVNSPNGNGIVVIGAPGTSGTISGNNIRGCANAILLSEADNNLTISGNSFSSNTWSIVTSILNLYPTLKTGFSAVTISGNQFVGNAVLQQNPISGLTVSANQMVSGILLTGNYSWNQSNFTVSNNTLLFGAKDVNLTSTPACFPLWTGTKRPVDTYSAGMKIDNKATFIPWTDQTWLNQAPAGNPFYLLSLDPLVKGKYPVGFSTTFQLGTTGSQNWALAPDPTWNTWTSPLPVTNGLTITAGANGLFSASQAPVYLIVLQTPPLSGQSNHALSPVTAALDDTNFNVITGRTDAVTAKLFTSANVQVPWATGSSSVVNAVNGLAVFNNLVPSAPVPSGYVSFSGPSGSQAQRVTVSIPS